MVDESRMPKILVIPHQGYSDYEQLKKTAFPIVVRSASSTEAHHLAHREIFPRSQSPEPPTDGGVTQFETSGLMEASHRLMMSAIVSLLHAFRVSKVAASVRPQFFYAMWGPSCNSLRWRHRVCDAICSFAKHDSFL